MPKSDRRYFGKAGSREGSSQSPPIARVALVARQTFPYDGRSIAAGKPFLARSPMDAQVLKTAGLAVDAPDPTEGA
jgi:hypothetical protein